MVESRREHTTALIRKAAIEEFTEIGSRALTLRSVAGRAHISNGAVYQRWPDKAACITDLVTNELPARTAAVRARWESPGHSLDELVREDLTDPVQLRELRFMVECVLAARDEPALVPVVTTELRSLGQSFAARVPEGGRIPEIGWWATSTWLGQALLRTSACPVPAAFVTAATSIMSTLGHAAQLVDEAALSSPDHIPAVEAPIVGADSPDPTSQALLDAATMLITEGGATAAQARAIAGSAGVTTGALYRRFAGTSEVFAAAFRSGLEPNRYAWTDEFLDMVGRQDFAGVAHVLAEFCKRIWTDRPVANRLLEFTVAAHTDAAVRAAIFSEMTRVAASRTQLFTALIDAGVIRRDLQADALAWLLQVPTVGMRLLASIGWTPDDAGLDGLLSAYLVFLIDEVE